MGVSLLNQGKEERLWLLNLGLPPGAHPDALSLPFPNSMGEENKMNKFMGQDKDREITYLLSSWTKQTGYGQNKFHLLSIKNSTN